MAQSRNANGFSLINWQPFAGFGAPPLKAGGFKTILSIRVPFCARIFSRCRADDLYKYRFSPTKHSPEKVALSWHQRTFV